MICCRSSSCCSAAAPFLQEVWRKSAIPGAKGEEGEGEREEGELQAALQGGAGLQQDLLVNFTKEHGKDKRYKAIEK
jgi:hypothetical protein